MLIAAGVLKKCDMSDLNNKKTLDKESIVFLSDSAGELEWIFPIIKYLLDNHSNISLVYGRESVKTSIANNATLSNFVNQSSKIKQYNPSWILNKIYHIGIHIHRYTSLNPNKFKPLNYYLQVIKKLLGTIYMRSVCYNTLQNNIMGRYIIFSQHSNLKHLSILRSWMEDNFINSIFIYHPHSPSLYSSNMEHDYIDDYDKSRENHIYAIFGNPGDFDALNEDCRYDVSEVTPVFTGHPKYSDTWISTYRDTSVVDSLKDRDNVVKILIISHNNTSPLVCTEKQHKSIVNSTIEAIHESIANFQIIVKEHPRVRRSYWNDIEEKKSSVTFTRRSVLEMACEVDFAISLFSSGPMDCFVVGTPVIEFTDPESLKLNVINSANEASTKCRNLGIVLPANDKYELKNAINMILNQDYTVSLGDAHVLFQKIVHRSNKWNMYFEKILDANNIFFNR